jgi:DNA-binding GntR family transcriptional regulator
MESPLSADPLQDQVAKSLRAEIESGDFPVGSKLPSEAELGKTYKVSRTTIRLALDQLVNAGLVIRSQGRGTFVRDSNPLQWHASRFENNKRADDDTTGLDAWATDVVQQGRTPRQEIDVSIRQPPRAVAARLRLDPERDRCVVRRRSRYVDNKPSLIADSYFPESIAAGTLLAEPGDVVAKGGVLKAIGHPQHHFVDEIAIRMPTVEEVSRLSIPPGTPVAEHTRTGYEEDGTPLRVMISILPGDRHVIIYEVQASE